ncbi:MAG: ATP synthase F1 subunit epsilon [Myxococcales bacterium]|nr:ATP synthase F1 subunit epsilon [Myxococcales bacterium]
MAATFDLRLLTPVEEILHQEAESVILPGEEGEFEVRAGHTRFLSKLAPGCMRVTSSGVTESFAVSGGFAEVSEQGLSVLADAAEPAGKIKVERAENARERAKKALAEMKRADTPEAEQQRRRLARAENRLRVAAKAQARKEE